MADIVAIVEQKMARQHRSGQNAVVTMIGGKVQTYAKAYVCCNMITCANFAAYYQSIDISTVIRQVSL